MAHRGAGNRDLRLAAELAAGRTQEEAARAARVSRRTVVRRLTEPDFRQLLSDARRVTYDRILGRTTADLEQSLDVLRGIVADPEKGDYARVNAIHAQARIGEALVRFRQADVLEERVDKLEDSFKGFGDRLDEAYQRLDEEKRQQRLRDEQRMQREIERRVAERLGERKPTEEDPWKTD